MANAELNLKRIQQELSVRRWSKMELYERMLACGWDGSWRAVYHVVNGEIQDPKLETIDAIATALGLPIGELYFPTRVESRSSARQREA